jgi:arylformamidase
MPTDAFIDLTMPIWAGMPYNPDHFPPELSDYATVATHGWQASRIVLDSHLGTHLDAPKHFVEGAAGIDQLDLHDLIGRYQVVRLAPVTAGTTISADSLPRRPASRVLLATGWSRDALGTETYFTHPPVLSTAAAERLAAAGTRVLGIDGPTVDMDGAAHRILLRAGCVIVENLIRLTELDASADVTILPLLIRGGDGSPVRAIARTYADDNKTGQIEC